jgi:hypothetical protein
MRYRRIAMLALLLPWIAVTGALAGQDEDPWLGKHVDEVTTVLGLPDKVKQAGEVRTLIYKLMLPGESPPLDPRIRLLQLPGVGLVAQFVREQTGTSEEVEYEPTAVDEDGRLVPGGYNTNSSASMSYNTKTKTVERNWEEGPDPGKVKKIKLEVEVDGEGRVRDWSVSPKKYMKTD